MGRKVYTSSISIDVTLTNKPYCPRRLPYWIAMSRFVEQLPEASEEELSRKAVWKVFLQSTLDVVDTSVKLMASAVTMRRSSWLLNSGIVPDIQQALKDLTLDSRTLFSDKTNDLLRSFKDLRILGDVCPACTEVQLWCSIAAVLSAAYLCTALFP